METRFNLIDVLTKDFDLIKKKFIGKQPMMVIKNNSETIEDRFQDQILYIIENYYDHYNKDYDKELDFINHLLRTKLQPKLNKQVQTIEYCDNYDNVVIDNYTDSYKEYYDKLQLLLIHYQI